MCTGRRKELVLSRSEEIKHKEHFITRNMSTQHGTRRSDLILEVLEALCLHWAPRMFQRNGRCETVISRSLWSQFRVLTVIARLPRQLVLTVLLGYSWLLGVLGESCPPKHNAKQTQSFLHIHIQSGPLNSTQRTQHTKSSSTVWLTAKANRKEHVLRSSLAGFTLRTPVVEAVPSNCGKNGQSSIECYS